MASEFLLYLRLGFHHIADLAGYDHILFIVALCVGYAPGEWRRLAVLVTAFTVGHSVTLALATLHLVTVPTRLVEALIPVTIIATALLTIRQEPRPGAMSGRYVFAAGFGLIHGLGFSTYLRTLLGQEENIALPLFGFNVGLEIGQLLILASVLAVSALVIGWMRISRRRWERMLAGAAGGVALVLLLERMTKGA